MRKLGYCLALVSAIHCVGSVDADPPMVNPYYQKSQAPSKPSSQDRLKAAQERLTASKAAADKMTDTHFKFKEHTGFQQAVERTLSAASEAAVGKLESTDIRTLRWLLKDYSQHVARENWAQADELKARMMPAMQRTASVAADAPRRKSEQLRLERERMHAQEMRQKERQHKEKQSQDKEYHQRMIYEQQMLRRAIER